MKISIPWTKRADTHGDLPLKGVYSEETRPTPEWDHTAQLDLNEAEETLGELRKMWNQEKARRDEGRRQAG